MTSFTLIKTYAEPPFCEKEILRYAGCKELNDEISSLLTSCIEEVRDKLSYKVCYRELPVSVTEGKCDFGLFDVQSNNLTSTLKGCRSVVLFAASIGIEIDRLISKYGRISPSRALMLQAIGAERIEALCDAFCEDLAKEKCAKLRPRFSPGYGDLSIEFQKDIFDVLECGKRIGLFLNDSLLMSPSKSVTAFVGLGDGAEAEKITKCSACNKADCAFRGV